MPYASTEEKNAHYREAYRKKYANDPAFRESEKQRKAAYWARDRDSNQRRSREQVAAWRAKQKGVEIPKDRSPEVDKLKAEITNLRNRLARYQAAAGKIAKALAKVG